MKKSVDNQELQFKQKLAKYKQLIDDDIAVYSEGVRQVTQEYYGEAAAAETGAFLSILSRGGKRIRGALVIVGYEMSGGKDQKMIVKAARAIEMLHAFFLVIDDIQDRSSLRRGGPSAHKILTQYHTDNGLKGDGEHFGLSIALNAAISGVAAAQTILAGLDIDPQLRLNVISIVARTMGVTAHGQTYDILNECTDQVSLEDIDRVMQLKTAEYTFLNPLCVGMVLAGADCAATDAIRDYALHIGKAFQITDDILGIFGEEKEIGKSPLDDAREGKQTLLVNYALGHVLDRDRALLRGWLGNEHLTNEQFKKLKSMLSDCGALEYTQRKASQHAAGALQALKQEAHRWPPDKVQFLHALAEYMLVRAA